MGKAERYVNAALLVFMGGVGGLAVGIVAGLVSGPPLLVILNYRPASDTGLLSLIMVPFGCATYGAIVGTVSGSLLGLTFCFIKHRIIGALGGSLVGSIVSFFLLNTPALSRSATVAQAFLMFAVGIIGGAIAGHGLSSVLLRSIKDN